MSDEPSKRSRAWFGLGLALVIAMYPLAVRSVGLHLSAMR
jgi:hypothetical protein